MISTVREERLLVVSDVHLGNELYRARRPFAQFLRYAIEHRFSVCVNGDGVDIVQTSLRRLARDLGSCAPHFADFQRAGLRLYYTVGNHDIALENFLTDWGMLQVVPFLNVHSGDRRIRVEHGHLYDENFVRYPRTYDVVTFLGGLALKVHPRVFDSFTWVQTGLVALGRVRTWLSGAAPQPVGIPGESPAFMAAAREIAERGFDIVVLGHTHHAGEVDLGEGRRYYNTGSWQHQPFYLEIIGGETRLLPVFGHAITEGWSRDRGSWMMAPATR